MQDYSNDEKVFLALRDLFERGKLAADDYYKGLVALAHSMVLSGQVARAMDILLIPTQDYYEIRQLEQIQQDPDYRVVVVEFARWMLEQTFTNLKPNMSPASC